MTSIGGVRNVSQRLAVGDTVAYSKRFLQSISEFTGDMPVARGKVTGLTPLGKETVLANVAWGIEDLPDKVNTANLSLVKDGVVMDVD